MKTLDLAYYFPDFAPERGTSRYADRTFWQRAASTVHLWDERSRQRRALACHERHETDVKRTVGRRFRGRRGQSGYGVQLCDDRLGHRVFRGRPMPDLGNETDDIGYGAADEPTDVMIPREAAPLGRERQLLERRSRSADRLLVGHQGRAAERPAKLCEVVDRRRFRS